VFSRSLVQSRSILRSFKSHGLPLRRGLATEQVKSSPESNAVRTSTHIEVYFQLTSKQFISSRYRHRPLLVNQDGETFYKFWDAQRLSPSLPAPVDSTILHNAKGILVRSYRSTRRRKRWSFWVVDGAQPVFSPPLTPQITT
jgi:hypothetical protein